MATGRDSAAVKVGPGRLYMAPIGTTEPTSLSIAPDAAFIDLGYTEEGTSFAFGTDTEPIEVAEEFYALDTIVTGKTVALSFSFAQDTAQNVYRALNGGTISSQGGAVTFEPPTPGTEVYTMILWEDGATAATNKRRYLFRRCFQTGNADLNHAKGADYTKLPAEFTALKPTGVEPFKAWYHPTLSGV